MTEWDEGTGDMFLEREIQSSRYNLVEADVAVQRQLYELHRQEATRLAKAQVCCGSLQHCGVKLEPLLGLRQCAPHPRHEAAPKECCSTAQAQLHTGWPRSGLLHEQAASCSRS